MHIFLPIQICSHLESQGSTRSNMNAYEIMGLIDMKDQVWNVWFCISWLHDYMGWSCHLGNHFMFWWPEGGCIIKNMIKRDEILHTIFLCRIFFLINRAWWYIHKALLEILASKCYQGVRWGKNGGAKSVDWLGILTRFIASPLLSPSFPSRKIDVPYLG